MLELNAEEIKAVSEFTGSKSNYINALLLDNILTDADFYDGCGQLITSMEELNSLMQLITNLYTAILKFSISNPKSISELYRGIDLEELKNLHETNLITCFKSTSTNFENTLDQYGNPLYDRKFLRINATSVLCLDIVEFYRYLWQNRQVDYQDYYSCFGESEMILSPFTKIINIEQIEIYNGNTKQGQIIRNMPIYDVFLHPMNLEVLSEELEKELYEEIVRGISEAKAAHNRFFKGKSNLNKNTIKEIKEQFDNVDLQKYIGFKKLVIKYLKSKLARLDLTFGYSRENLEFNHRDFEENNTYKGIKY